MTREPEDRATEISQNETQKGREIKKKKKKTIDKLWVNMQRRKKKRWGKICEEILERLEILYI